MAGALAAPLASEALQTGKVARLELLGLFTPELGSRNVAAVREGLGDLGWHEGQSMHFGHSYASEKRDQLAALAAELVQQKVDVIVAFGTDATRAARGATSSIPIVMGAVADPVGSGFVTGLARPGGNVTGVSLLMTDLIGKQRQLLREVTPRASRISVISLGGLAPDRQIKDAQAAAPHHRVKLHRILLREPLTLDDLAPQLRMARVNAVLGLANPALDDVRIRIVEIANAQRLPSIFTLTYWAEAGPHELLCRPLCAPPPTRAGPVARGRPLSVLAPPIQAHPGGGAKWAPMPQESRRYPTQGNSSARQHPRILYNIGLGPLLQRATSKEAAMLWTIAVILLVLWALGMVTSYTAGGVVHLLLVIAVIVIVFQFIGGRRSI